MFNRITTENICTLKLPRESSLINHSTFTNFKSDILFRSFSIKYVIQGTETYKIEGKNHQINENQFLLANHFSGGQLTIDNSLPVHGICVDIEPRIIEEVINAIKKPEICEYEPELIQFFNSDFFPANNFHINEKRYGLKIQQIANQIIANKDNKLEFNSDLFYHLAEQIVFEEAQNYKLITAIPSVKNQTKKDIHLKLIEAKKYIDTYYLSINSIASIAQNCSMSEYHFYRHFKSYFKITPLQYIQNKKNLFALNLIKNTNNKLNEIAHLAGFIDLPSFSKSFKKYYGISPNHFRIKNSRK